MAGSIQGDQDAYIASVNLKRRNLTKGQKAMLVAKRYPDDDGEGGRGKKGQSHKLAKSGAFAVQRLREARVVLHKCPHLVDLVIDGSMALSAAYAEAQRRRAASPSEPATTCSTISGHNFTTARVAIASEAQRNPRG
ncbi:hypothetical protein AB4Y40_16180 [Paraburkholderia sp. EG287B]|uniref:hypothetical protein n=1 Tax=Paraburkholderia sp. EG287B TaxID=3237010 RepID=UPI0034D1F043